MDFDKTLTSNKIWFNTVRSFSNEGQGSYWIHQNNSGVGWMTGRIGDMQTLAVRLWIR